MVYWHHSAVPRQNLVQVQIYLRLNNNPYLYDGSKTIVRVYALLNGGASGWGYTYLSPSGLISTIDQKSISIVSFFTCPFRYQ